uniref:Uncharacterized protein n=1 Tax=Oryza brachyantha TaxID=4533 RepID=J3LL09_ORYBR
MKLSLLRAATRRSVSAGLLSIGGGKSEGSGTDGRTNREKRVPQSQRYSREPQVLVCAFQSDWTAYFLEHLSHFHFFSPCLRRKCFLMPVRSPSARDGSWCTQLGSGHTYTRFRTSFPLRCRSFHGRLWPRRCSCRFWSRWNPLLQISHTNLLVASSVLGDSAITSALGSAPHHERALDRSPSPSIIAITPS